MLRVIQMNNLKFTSLIILLLLLINNLTLASENVVIPAGTELIEGQTDILPKNETDNYFTGTEYTN